MGDKYSMLKQNLIRHLPTIVFVYCVLQPILDVASYWQTELEINNVITVLLRMGLLGGSVLLGFVLTDRKWIYWAAAVVLGGFLAARTMACLEAGYVDPVEDLLNMARIYSLPLMTLSMCTFVKKNERSVRAIQSGVAVNLMIIVAVMVLSRLTGTDSYTYRTKDVGVMGWFLVTSCQSAIVSMIAPIAIGWALTRWDEKVWPVLLISALALGGLYAIGTRLSFAAMVATGVGMSVSLMLIDRTRWRQALAIICCALALLAAMPLSPMVRNQTMVGDNFKDKQNYLNDMLSGSDSTAELDEDALLIQAYNSYIPGIITRFGAEKTLEAYGRTEDASIISNARTMKITFCKLLQEESPESARWFGMSVTRMREWIPVWNQEKMEREEVLNYYDPENDFHGIYYLCGIVGLAGTVLFFAYFAINALFALLRDWRRYMTIDFMSMAICCCIAVVDCYFTACILRNNASTGYLAMALAGLWYLSRRERSAKRMQGN